MLLTSADLIKQGAGWPLAGGWLCQTQAVIDGVMAVWDNENYWKSKTDG